MSEAYQFSIVRFVPDIVRDEGVNVGVIARSMGAKHFEFRFLPRTSTLLKLSPDTDRRLVGNFERQLRRLKSGDNEVNDGLGLVGHPTDSDFFDRAREEFNGNLQLTSPRAYMADCIEDVVHHAYMLYVADPAVPRRPINYQLMAPYQIRQRLWSAFEKRNLLRPGLVQREPVLPGKHAPWTFDLSYMNGNLNLISSIALNADTAESNLGRALVLKGMMDEIREGQHAEVHGVAVVQTGRSTDGLPGEREAEALLRDADISIVPIARVGQFAQDVEANLLAHTR